MKNAKLSKAITEEERTKLAKLLFREMSFRCPKHNSWHKAGEECKDCLNTSYKCKKHNIWYKHGEKCKKCNAES